MATQFPEELDSFLNPQPTDSVAAVSHAAQHSNTNDAITALQAKVGVDGSSVTTSLDYRVTTLENASIDPETIQDLVDGVLFEGTGIVKLYDDNLNTITLSVDTTTIATNLYADNAADLAASAALTDANEYTDIAITALSAVYDPLGSASAAQTAAQLYADGLASNYDPAGSASAALADANEYTDIAVASLGNSIGENYVPISLIGQVDGVASLGPDGKVPASELNITESIQDVAAGMITSGTHTNISVSYNDENGTLSFTGSAPQLTQEEIQDYVAPLLNHSLHTNITATYDDQNNKILLTGNSSGASLTQEEVQDFVAPLLNHAFHSNITATYDDANNRIVLQGNSGGGGASVIISPTAPSEPGLGDIWLDSDNGKTYIWDGAYWIEVGAGSAQAVAAVVSTPPTNPILGSIWLNSSTAKTYIYDGSYWVQI